ncbi:MAG: hypothetical protein KGQ66_00665 [Acidobacteriota bacterium]|nr:hypothetical protein [Acidobacteriota bacterium]
MVFMADEAPEMEIHPEDPDDEWVTRENTGRSFRVRYLTAGLLVLGLLGGGFWGGVVAEKHHGSGTSSALSALASRFAAARGGGAGTGGAGGGLGGFGGAGGAATAGTVIDVQGDVVDISDSAGNIVKVTVGPATRVTRTATTPVSGLQIGDTVIVSGTTGAGGTVQATAVRASAAGSATGAAAGAGGSGGIPGGVGGG